MNPGPSFHTIEPATPSSSRSPNPPEDHAVDRDELTPFWTGEPDSPTDLLGDNTPRANQLDEPISFKRKPKQGFLSSSGRFLSALTGGRPSTSTPEPSPRRADGFEDASLRGMSPTRSPARFGNGRSLNLNSTKDGVPLDWYVEGPGRRVRYEDLTAIDWIFEYTKERQRLRVLYSGASGLLGYIRQFLDASQVWVVLVLTGLAVGAVAAVIDVTTNWLGDLKTGFCSSGPEGGAFYLNRGFCCLGYDQGSKCVGWKPWSEALHISSSGGKWVMGYIFFIMFSVGGIAVRSRTVTS